MRFVPWLVAAAAVIPGFTADLAVPTPNTPKIAGASEEGELAIKRFQAPPGFKVELFAAEPMLAHPVAFGFDEHNRVYVSESFRVGEQVTDIRKHMAWLDEELASTNTAQWRILIEKYLDRKFMLADSERISVLEDTNHDGRADKSTVFAEGFADLTSGIAAGVLARKGDVWFTCIPDLWRLRDENGDGKADVREVLQHGYAVRFGFYGHDLHGLRIGPDGKLYFSIGDRGLNVVNRERKRIASPESGAVLRCNLDGSNLELFATGLRNPQELAFDQYGNLFTGDNNSDGGDQARWVYVVEGGDSGWRIGWQFINTPVPRGPWNAEKMWQPRNAEQPAFLVPPLANFANGPSGLTFNPGTSLPPEYAHHFLMCDFKGNNAQSLVHSFAVVAEGASFAVTDRQPFLSQILATDVEFGMDGGVYISDWVEGWGKTGKGRIYRMHHASLETNHVAAQTKQLMAHGFESRSLKELANLLDWPDQRVRQEAQFELATRGTASVATLTEVARAHTNQLARLHAIWGLGQMGDVSVSRGRPSKKISVAAPLISLLDDADPEIRAQAAKLLGDLRHAGAGEKLVKLINDSSAPRVQFFAAMTLGKVGGKTAGPAVLTMLAGNADRDPYLRHAGVMALYHLNDSRLLTQAGKHQSPAVRLAGLLAMRRRANSHIAQFLGDTDPRVVLEAARAIYDLPIGEAMPALASLISRPNTSEPLLRRVVNAHRHIGTANSAQALATFAATPTAVESARLEALQALTEWAKPAGRDPVTGLWRPLPTRDASVAASALRPVINNLLATGSPAVQVSAARLVQKYRIATASPALINLAGARTAASSARVAALRALTALNDASLPRLLEQAVADPDEELRKEAVGLLAKQNPEAGAKLLAEQMNTGSVGEKQSALLALGELQSPSAERTLGEWLDRLLRGQADPAFQLELLEAATSHKSPEMQEKLKRFQQARPTNEIGGYLETLQGGDAAAGKRIFFEKQEASCARCHKVGGTGGEAGPPLDTSLATRSREYILESILAPAKTIAPGYENVIVTLKSGIFYAGTVQSETETDLVLNSPEEGGLVKVSKQQIESRQVGGSGMPAGLADLLSKREVRDLVEFLSTSR